MVKSRLGARWTNPWRTIPRIQKVCDKATAQESARAMSRGKHESAAGSLKPWLVREGGG